MRKLRSTSSLAKRVLPLFALGVAIIALAAQFSFELNNTTKQTITVKLTNDLEKSIVPGSRSGFSRVTTDKERSDWAILDIVTDGGECSVKGFSLPMPLPAREAVKLEAFAGEDGHCVVKKG